MVDITITVLPQTTMGSDLFKNCSYERRTNPLTLALTVDSGLALTRTLSLLVPLALMSSF